MFIGHAFITILRSVRSEISGYDMVARLAGAQSHEHRALYKHLAPPEQRAVK